ncbi:HAD hydrolase-like protein [Alicyclobacillus cycloheptanicus]|uniref:FMN phosphatase YigB (HAD superfamily) n=1 Tax=Alicyclobacillus cycloheptanicus TaxID=1457 RepID=A0ABT9XK97_9BACL|nr:HAD family hydrolase [Alicyclobacillus cycloheptanicus]MDQ0190736.1 FMN phosphatase YigB (HAD superfamily) [Alicyclobacillus cycloheptanicus]WDL99873.1 HAD hydrolase-like protein [Alicyclobacillus cycloheptanicus]
MTTLLFDLDGTLLPLDLNTFLKGYFEALVPRIAHLVDRRKIVDQIMQATQAMMLNEDASFTNEEVFKASFFRIVDVPEEQIWPIFDAFYREAFGELRHLTQPSPISREICRTAVDKGYQLVLATNPIFPEQAVRHRMAWAGIEDIPFDLVTVMETSHFCKPNPKYYVEIMDKLGVTPSQCMMFGNDIQEDGVAGTLGMQTFLVTDWLVDHGAPHIAFTHQGTLADVRTFVQSLPDMA